jgi:hypothetical protein
MYSILIYEASRCAARAVLGLARRTVERCPTNSRLVSLQLWQKRRKHVANRSRSIYFGAISSRKKNSPLVGGFFSFFYVFLGQKSPFYATIRP